MSTVDDSISVQRKADRASKGIRMRTLGPQAIDMHQSLVCRVCVLAYSELHGISRLRVYEGRLFARSSGFCTLLILRSWTETLSPPSRQRQCTLLKEIGVNVDKVQCILLRNCGENQARKLEEM